VYGSSPELLGEYAQDGAAIQEVVWFDGQPLIVLGQANSNEVFFGYSDHLGAPRILVDRTGVERWRWIAEPFGSTTAEPAPSGLAAVAFPLRFPGQYFDAETGLNYNYFRNYDSTSGRYTTPDPLGLAAADVVLYNYVFNQPTRFTDPTGQVALVDDAVILAAIGVGVILMSPPGQAALKKGADAISQACTGDPCKELNDDVQRAKDKVGSFKPAKCSLGMPRWQLQQRHDAWLEEATARSKRDQKCWAGGDAGHQLAQARAWSHVGQCGSLLK
jgi:RHS repeat-associated protein